MYIDQIGAVAKREKRCHLADEIRRINDLRGSDPHFSIIEQTGLNRIQRLFLLCYRGRIVL